MTFDLARSEAGSRTAFGAAERATLGGRCSEATSPTRSRRFQPGRVPSGNVRVRGPECFARPPTADYHSAQTQDDDRDRVSRAPARGERRRHHKDDSRNQQRRQPRLRHESDCVRRESAPAYSARCGSADISVRAGARATFRFRRCAQRALAGRSRISISRAITESGQIVPDLLEVLRVMTFRAHRHFKDGWRQPSIDRQ